MGPHCLYWKIIWRLKILPIIRVFACRVGHEIMPTNMKVGFNRPNVNPMCQRCGAAKETLIYAIKECPSTRATLTYGWLDDRLISFDFEHYIDWLEADMRLLDKKAMEDLITLHWNSWNNKNNFTFHGKEAAEIILGRAITISNDFRIHSLNNNPMLPLHPAM
ncbi:hypothetical protein Golax_022839 [Gossypium laxum]|uniref:Reverse transcriptase zinc-binding domain-containing protein n=1 Tax=Gossypium laxum TaxID=34288 RepID=A0A7J9B257_9ROSI|nr:hypothetical protein [Gossypium laxum]